jgi:hypothetical protein
VLESAVALTPEPSAPGLYEWSGGQLRFVSLLAGETPAGEPAVGYENADDRQAISDDGSRVVWSERGGEGHIYQRDTTTRTTAQLDVTEAGVEAGEGIPQFSTANASGSRVLFTDSKRLTADSMASGSGTVGEPRDLYEANTETGKLTDLTVDPGEGAAVQGVIGASEDASYVYFVANGVLAEGAAPGNCVLEAGLRGITPPPGAACNLYVWHEGTITFIARLSSEDEFDWAGAGGGDLSKVTARVSPAGGYVAFMSERSLTGYDNRDVNSGQPDEEVYLYAVGSRGPMCVSCNPTGARPEGVLDTPEANGGLGLLVDRAKVWTTGSGRWLAGSVPGWEAVEGRYALYQPRYLLDDGRVFFDSSDSLVSQDGNRKEDVYQYEPAGVGDCTDASKTFSLGAAGCIDLLSSGTSADESAFLDAGASGEDVFFLTAAALVAQQDRDTAYDVYDAHVCTPSSPCEPPRAEAAPCTGEGCQGALTPAPSLLSPTSIDQAAGENAALTSPAKPKAKPLTRAQRLARALKACRKKPRRRRAACRRQARRRYDGKAAHRTSRWGR